MKTVRAIARAATIAMTSGAFLAGSLVMAAPASAALTSVTPTTCAGEGGTYSRAKGVSTCVVRVSAIRYVEENTFYNATVMGPFENLGNYPDAGYYAEWKLRQGFRDTITYTQKGKRAVESTTVSALVRQTMTYQGCFSIVGGGYGYAIIAQCDSLGMYPADINLP